MINDALHHTTEKFPNRTALHGTHGYTYAELSVVAEHIARRVLHETRDDPTRPVLVLGPTDALTMALVLGVMRAGRMMGVLDVRWPDARLRETIAAVGACAVCVTDDQRSRAAALGIAGLSLITIDADAPVEGELPLVDCADVLLFTSGSTGRAKAVQAPASRFQMMADRGDEESGPAIERVGVLLPISFDHGLNRSMYALLTGRTAVYYDLAARGLQGMTDWVHAQRVDELSMPIDVARSWLDDRRAAGVAAPLPLKKIVVTGAVYGRDVAALQEHLEPDAVVGTVYAATEIARIAVNDMRRGQTHEPDELLPVGRPYAEMQVRIVWDDGQAAAIGERGRLYVSTPYLARGYYGDEAATTQRFLRRADGECEYDTGDLASLDADGQLRIYGRQDHVVKIRMQRIDLVEVDAALQSLPAVTSAASYVRDAGSAREQLAALVTLNAGATLDMQTMRGALARTLPPYMIPADVRVASRLPQTRTHKLDRPAVASIADSLPKLPLDALGATNLRDDIERELAAIWSDALAAPITDRYVELCGPHVAPEAMHVVLHRTRTQMAVILTIDDVQTHPTLAELAVIVRERGRDAKHASPMRCVVPLSSGPAGQAAYIAPAAGSGASRHRALADALAPRRSVFGLQPLGFDEGEQPHETFAAMTAQYAEEISRATPHGSLVLIGECYGSYVVLDVARRLQAVGREIRLLVLLDPPVRLVRRRSRAAVDLVDLWGECAGFIRCRQWSSLWAVLKLQVVRRTITPLSCVRRRADRVFTAQSDALHWHGPEPYGGRVLHIASEVGARDPRARDFWKSLCVGRYEHTVLAGTNHHDIGNGDHATRVARIIEEGLNHEP